MTPQKDIATAEDVRSLVDAFYTTVRQDALLGPIFNGIIGDDWSHHTPRIYAFWEAILLGTAGYTGNAVLKHIELSRKFTLSQTHFDHWLAVWADTVDALFQGEKATEAKQKARTMAGLMMFKIDAAGRPGFVA